MQTDYIFDGVGGLGLKGRRHEYHHHIHRRYSYH